MARSRWAGVVLLWAFSSVQAFGQTGVIQGIVTDPQGAVVPNAKLAAVDEAKGIVVREAVSEADGSFQLRPLLPGTYTVKVEAQDFKPLERKGLVLDVNQVMNLGALALQLGTARETVTVSAEVPLVETATAQKSFVLSSRQVTEISLNGRDFQSLMRTLPGVVSNDRSDFRLAFNNTDSFNTNGLRGSMNNVYMDGAINTDVGANDGQYTQVSLDSVGEFKVQTSTFNAEYGRNPGILINITTKSGGSEFHGTAYEFARNDAFDANAFFRNLQRQGKAKLRFNQFGGNISGPIYLPHVSTRSDKRLFFFFNYEGTRATQPRGGTSTDVPDQDLLNGDFRKLLRGVPIATAPQFDIGTVFQPGTITRNNANQITGGTPFGTGCTTTFPVSSPTCNIVPQAAWSQNAPAFLKILGEIDRSKGGPVAGTPNLVRIPFQDTYKFRKDQKVLRLDWNISPQLNFFFRWADDSQREQQGLGIFSGNPYPVLPQFRKKPGASWSWNLVKVISPRTTNEFIFNYNHLTQVVDVVESTDPATYDRDKLGFKFQELYPNSNLRNKFPRISGCGTGCDFNSFASGWLSEGKTFAWTDNLTMARGAHTFKTGIYFNINHNGQQPAWTDSTSFNFGTGPGNPNDSNNGLANLLLGNYTSLSQSNGRFYGTFAFLGLEFYGQDSWKVSRRLTLEYGARYVYLGPTYTYGRFLQNYFDPALYDPSKAVQINIQPGNLRGSIVPGSGNPFNGMIEENSPGVPHGFLPHRKNQVSPRFGFAWDPFGDGKTSVRGGFGSFYERIRQNINNFDGLGNPPLSYTPSVFAGQVDQVTSTLVSSGVRFPVDVRAIEKNGKTPVIYSWSFDIQRQLGQKTSLDVAYVGNSTRHLQYSRNLNQLPLGTTTSTPILTNANGVADAIRPFRGYRNVNITDFGANSNYQALQARVSRRFGEGLTGNIGYTWSKAMSIVDTDGASIGYFLDRQREYGPAGYDRTHVLTFDYVYALPKAGTRWVNNPISRSILNGWELSGITTFASGFPRTITAGGNDPGTLGGDVRADYIGGNILPANQTYLEWFNPLAFGSPVNSSLGNTGKGIIRGPGINQWNISLFKNTKISERVTTQFRLETFNTFNHTQLDGGSLNTGVSGGNPGQPVTAATRGSSGTINNTRDPRNIQLSLKLYF